MKQLKDINLQNKRVLIRADFNVPLDENLKITNNNRIKEFIPTVRYILENGGKPIIMSHLGRPDGKPNPKYSLKSVVGELEKLSGAKVVFADDCIGSATLEMSNKIGSNEILLIENLRFYDAEEGNDLSFAKELAKLGDVYVNDAFGTAHREHASMVGVPKLLTEKAPGLLMQKEIDYYNKVLIEPKRPLCVVLGGSKVSTKLPILTNLAKKADKIIIGGAMANTFLSAQGIQVGRSLHEPDLHSKVIEIMGTLARRNCKLYIPVDFKVGKGLTSEAMSNPVTSQEIPADLMALDIGPATCILYETALNSAETILWNGPMGAFENPSYAEGTEFLTKSIASAQGLSVVGGGDTVVAVENLGLEHKFDFISTGGGAFLSLLEGNSLPGFDALE